MHLIRIEKDGADGAPLAMNFVADQASWIGGGLRVNLWLTGSEPPIYLLPERGGLKITVDGKPRRGTFTCTEGSETSLPRGVLATLFFRRKV